MNFNIFFLVLTLTLRLTFFKEIVQKVISKAS